MNAKRLSHANRSSAPTALVAAIALLLALGLLAVVANASWGARMPCASCLMSQIIEAIAPSIDATSPFAF